MNLLCTSVWPDEQRSFFNVYMPSKDAWGAALCCGTSAVIRVEALEKCRGFATDTVQGTIPEIELTRLEALLSSAELETIPAEGRVQQQETILRSELWKRGTSALAVATTSITPKRCVPIPVSDEVPVSTSAAAANAKRIGIEVVSSYQTRGSIVSPLGAVAFDLGKVVQGGIQFDLPVRNRLAQADAIRAILEVRQAEAQAQRFTLRVREEVESSIIALRTARAGLNAATRSRRYEEALLDAERVKLTAGASTNLSVLEREASLAQARSTEIVARNTWTKARLTWIARPAIFWSETAFSGSRR